MTGSRVTARPSQVRMFLKADTAEDLVRLQLQTNLMIKGRIDLVDISNVDGTWYGWFMIDIDSHPEVVEFLNGST